MTSFTLTIQKDILCNNKLFLSIQKVRKNTSEHISSATKSLSLQESKVQNNDQPVFWKVKCYNGIIYKKNCICIIF